MTATLDKTDLINLTGFYYTDISSEDMLAVATKLTQELFTELMKQPVTQSQRGIVIKLPSSKTSEIPREKEMPKAREPTKWEKFAKENGIKKRTRDKTVFEPISNTWVKRWGRNGINDLKRVHVIESDRDYPEGEDPFLDDKRAKDDRKKANKEKQRKNELARLKEKNKQVAPGVIALTANMGERTRHMKHDIDRAVGIAQRSTASMGQFDKKRRGEKDIAKPLKYKKRVANPLDEADMSKKVLGRIIRNLDGDGLDDTKAVGRGQQSEQRKNRKRKIKDVQETILKKQKKRKVPRSDL